MKTILLFILSSVILLLSLGNTRHENIDSSYQSKATLKKIAFIDLPGEKGKRFDYLTIDYKHNYLLSAHLAADVSYIIDIKSNKLVKMIKDTPGAEGIEYVPELNKVYTSNRTDHTIGVIDMNKMEVIKKIPAKNKPDGSAYAAPFQKLYVSDELAKALIVVDVNKDEVLRLIQFESETGMPQYDPSTKMIYVSLQEQNLFAVIDPSNDKVIGKYPVGDCTGNHGMALDIENHLAFLVCENNDMLTVFNLKTNSPVAHLKIPSGADVVKYDPGLKRIYVACSSGFISVIREVDPNHFVKQEDFSVQKNVHTLAVDINTHRVYAPEQEEDGKPVSRMIVYEAIL
jgi:DNA-binding beta-propeller fold protein YncE